MNKSNEPVKNQATDEMKKDVTSKEQPSKEQTSKEQPSKEQPSREQAFKNTSPEDMSAAQKEQDKRPTDNSRDMTGLDKNSFNNDGAPVHPGNKQEVKGSAGKQQQPAGSAGGQEQQPAGSAGKKDSTDKNMKKDDPDMKENMGSGRRQDDN